MTPERLKHLQWMVETSDAVGGVYGEDVGELLLELEALKGERGRALDEAAIRALSHGYDWTAAQILKLKQEEPVDRNCSCKRCPREEGPRNQPQEKS